MKMMTMMNNQVLDLKKYDFVISIGEMFADVSLEINDATLIYFHPIDNEKLNYTEYIKYEAGCEEAVLAMLLNMFCQNESLKEKLDEFDIGYLSAESNVGEEEIEEIYELSLSKENLALVISDDLFKHKNSQNIKALLNNIKNSTKFELVCNCDLGNDDNINEIEELDTYDGSVIYTSLKAINKSELIGSATFAKLAKVNDNDSIEINFGGESLSAIFKLDNSLKGTIGLYSSENHNVLNEGYPYKQVKIKKVDL